MFEEDGAGLSYSLELRKAIMPKRISHDDGVKFIATL